MVVYQCQIRCDRLWLQHQSESFTTLHFSFNKNMNVTWSSPPSSLSLSCLCWTKMLCHLVAYGTMASVSHLCWFDWQPTGALTDCIQCHVRAVLTADIVEKLPALHTETKGEMFQSGNGKTFLQREPFGPGQTNRPLSALLCSSQRNTWPLTPARTSKCCHNCQTP